MSKNRFSVWRMPALLLAFVLVLAGCDNPGGPVAGDNTEVVSALTLGDLVFCPKHID
jgi:hypothetical protein